MRTRLAAIVGAAFCAAAAVGLSVAASAPAPAPEEALGAAEAAKAHAASGEVVSRIAFGSCLKQNRPQPIWDAVLAARPDVFVFLGDNVYADTSDIDELKSCYDRLAAQPGFQALREACSVLATWDDHDYCKNGSDGSFRGKRDSQRVFADFWGDGPDSPRRGRDGVYDAVTFGPDGRRVQIILLDGRFFRSKRQGTMLGEAQWKWLEGRLREEADVRIIASCSQFVASHHGADKWADIPSERNRMIELINRTGAKGVIFISGDRHHAELSRLTAERRHPVAETGLPWDPSGDARSAAGESVPAQPSYPLYDVTSSSLNRAKWFVMESNPHRLGKAFPKSNFGLIEIDWSRSDPVISMQVRDVEGRVRISHEVLLSELQG